METVSQILAAPFHFSSQFLSRERCKGRLSQLPPGSSEPFLQRMYVLIDVSHGQASKRQATEILMLILRNFLARFGALRLIFQRAIRLALFARMLHQRPDFRQSGFSESRGRLSKGAGSGPRPGFAGGPPHFRLPPNNRAGAA